MRNSIRVRGFRVHLCHGHILFSCPHVPTWTPVNSSTLPSNHLDAARQHFRFSQRPTPARNLRNPFPDRRTPAVGIDVALLTGVDPLVRRPSSYRIHTSTFEVVTRAWPLIRMLDVWDFTVMERVCNLIVAGQPLGNRRLFHPPLWSLPR